MLFLRWLLPFRTQQAAEEGPVLQLTSQNDAEAAKEGFLLWSIIPAAPYARIRELSEETFSDPGGLSRSFQSLRRLANIKVIWECDTPNSQDRDWVGLRENCEI
ncbi:uncharacterized protein ACHE_31095S [Aspergillus chevalieri]|uniref:Uncharacterized protein n=1 Tax=Aspergillus chevalieri TaxID=182096 RepID=A0A7R7ZM51_ASPCH|nr:uncharacterized protein ACHE_31095S [Aspergillus chevalieri]BCR87108.1 hypothetical protein ACHE_31095S [Aspergillus chevalieri]